MSARPLHEQDMYRDVSDPARIDLPVSDPSGDDLLLGLQLCRANTMSLTRLQLALRSGDRRGALDSIDRLHALDARFEHLVQRFPRSANENGELQAIEKHLDEQKIAIAFQKLALASGISGPDLVSETASWAPDQTCDDAGNEGGYGEGFVSERRSLGQTILWGLLTVLPLAAVGGVVAFFMLNA
jgi:hypothetical protein